MSRHVMHSIACEIYVNTAIRSVESAVSLSLFLSFPPTTHPLTPPSRTYIRIRLLYEFLILILARSHDGRAMSAMCG